MNANGISVIKNQRSAKKDAIAHETRLLIFSRPYAATFAISVILLYDKNLLEEQRDQCDQDKHARRDAGAVAHFELLE